MKNLFFTVKNCIQNIEAFLNDYLNKAGSVVTVPYLAYVNWGIHLARTADVDNAVEKLETAVLMNPSSVSAHMNLGIVFLQKEQYEKALKEFLTSIDLDEENAHAYSLAATVLSRFALSQFTERFARLRNSFSILTCIISSECVPAPI